MDYSHYKKNKRKIGVYAVLKGESGLLPSVTRIKIRELHHDSEGKLFKIVGVDGVEYDPAKFIIKFIYDDTDPDLKIRSGLTRKKGHP